MDVEPLAAQSSRVCFGVRVSYRLATGLTLHAFFSRQRNAPWLREADRFCSATAEGRVEPKALLPLRLDAKRSAHQISTRRYM